MSAKLQSLQGLRGISIILVILFHLFPTKFVNGFVGVDMFFVLSGYLMARILSREITIKSVIDFFQKRFNRIIPLYYLTIFFTIIGVLTFVLKTERIDFLNDIKWCLYLISNIQPIFEHHSYWHQVSSIRYLTHLWSLSTELQYYLLAPIIHFTSSKFTFFNRILAYSLTIFLSFSFQISTPSELSYCFPVSRIWQFLIGSVAFEYSRREDCVINFFDGKRRLVKDNTLAKFFPFLFLSLLSATFSLPSIFGETSTRLILSISAAVLCCFCGQLENSCFTFPPLVYIGNISYVTYLLHWPVINFVRYIQQKDHSSLDVSEAIISVLFITVLSILAHHFLENKLLYFNFLTNFAMTIFIVCFCYSAIPFVENSQCLTMNTLSSSLIESAEFNLDDINLLKNVSDLGCDVTEQDVDFSFDTHGIEYCARKGTGYGKVLVIGNSVAVRAFPRIFEIFNGQYGEIRLFAKHGAAPLLNNFPYYNKAALQMAEEMNPDLLWIIQGMNEILFQKKHILKHFPPSVVDREAQKQIDGFKQFAGMVYVDLPYFITDYLPAKLIARSLIYRKDIDEKLSASFLKVEKQIGIQTRRLMNLNCSNCHFIDVQKALTTDQDRFYFYERRSYRALNYDGSHLTSTAYKYIDPVYQDKIEQFKKLMFDNRQKIDHFIS